MNKGGRLANLVAAGQAEARDFVSVPGVCSLTRAMLDYVCVFDNTRQRWSCIEIKPRWYKADWSAKDRESEYNRPLKHFDLNLACPQCGIEKADVVYGSITSFVCPKCNAFNCAGSIELKAGRLVAPCGRCHTISEASLEELAEAGIKRRVVTGFNCVEGYIPASRQLPVIESEGGGNG